MPIRYDVDLFSEGTQLPILPMLSAARNHICSFPPSF
jgi:hypothetical protein